MICIAVDASRFLQAGDFWEFEDVYGRTTILIDDQPTGEWGGISLDYMLGYTKEDHQGNIVARVGGPYRWCVHTPPMMAGVHRVDIRFEKSDGEVVSFAWTFELVAGPLPTPTPPPTPAEVDRAGHLPGYIEAVYPLPGETVVPPSDLEGWASLLEAREMPAARLTGSHMQPVCVTLVHSKFPELGTLPMDNDHIYEHLYLTVDGQVLQDWLYPRRDFITYGNVLSQCAEANLSPGEHVAVFYIVPFDREPAIYSWVFTVSER